MILGSYYAYAHARHVGVSKSIASYFPSLHFSTTPSPEQSPSTDKSLADVGR